MRSNWRYSKSGLLLLSALLLTSCGAFRRSPQSARTDREITRVVWIAGSVALEAQRAYLDGEIPNKPEYKAAINSLGLSYEEAKRLQLTYLDAKAEYQVALALAAGCPPADQACIDVGADNLARREAALQAAFVALQAIVAELPAHIETVRRILGAGVTR